MNVYELIRKLTLQDNIGNKPICIFSIDDKGVEHTYEVDEIFPEYLGDNGEHPVVTIKIKETF